MVALAASDITITVNQRTIQGKKRRNRVTITFGDASLTYSTGGIPFPDIENYGMKRNLDGLIWIEPMALDGFIYKYDVSAQKLVCYESGTASATLDERDAADAPAATVLVAEAIGW